MHSRRIRRRVVVAVLLPAVIVATAILLIRFPIILFKTILRPKIHPPTAAYVALGDSFTAAPKLAPQSVEFTPKGCGQSRTNYPHLVARELRVESFTDVSCSGAETGSVSRPQWAYGAVNAAQGDALSTRTRLVTVGMGGNDAQIYRLLFDCVGELGGPPSNCRDRYVTPDGDELDEHVRAVSSGMVAMLDEIRRRAPRSRVFVVGYPQILPSDGRSCPTEILLTGADMAYFDGGIRKLNALLKSASEVNGAEYVDTYTPSIGHHACSGRHVRWVESMAPVPPAVELHPNVRGQRGVARAVVKAVTRERRAGHQSAPRALSR